MFTLIVSSSQRLAIEINVLETDTGTKDAQGNNDRNGVFAISDGRRIEPAAF